MSWSAKGTKEYLTSKRSGQDVPFYREILEEIRSSGHKKILSVGSGTGELEGVLSQSASCHITCLEPNVKSQRVLV